MNLLPSLGQLKLLSCLLPVCLLLPACGTPTGLPSTMGAPPRAVVYRQEVVRVYTTAPRRAPSPKRRSEFEEYRAKHKLSKNSFYNSSAQRVGARLASVIPMTNADWEFIVFDNPMPNAFASSGGKVGINSGLFKIVKNDAQLAAVLGHEISHVTANHAAKREAAIMFESQRAADAANRAPNQKAALRLAQIYALQAAINSILPFSRAQELEADKIGTIYMARAGYNPSEAVQLWLNFAAIRARDGSGGDSEMLSSHPLDAHRIEVLKDFLPVADAEYRQVVGPSRRAGFWPF